MSSRVSETLSVLRLLALTPASELTLQDRARRISATKEVASDLGITHNTVRDALTRQLKPDIQGVHSLDALVLSWRRDGSRELEDAIQRHTVDSTDASAVSSFFERYRPPA